MNLQTIEPRFAAFPTASTVGVQEMLNAAETLGLDMGGLDLLCGSASPTEGGRPGYELPLGLAGTAYLDRDDAGVWQIGIDFRDVVTFEQYQAATVLIVLAHHYATTYGQ